ncbi:MAG: hypothetical protein GY771_04645, partial [bacterium]|nr:hypothetical protein [bacterium]
MANKNTITAALFLCLFTASAFAVVPQSYGAEGGDGGSGSFESFALSRAISDIWVDSAGVIWIATNAGLGRSADGGITWTSFSEEQGLSGN